jgi:formylglycine-generating enzyme required for sulfatase activity
MKHSLPLIVFLGFSIMTALPGSPGRLQAAEVAPQTLKLLKSFSDEFVPITPGEGKFPASFLMGTANGPFFEQPAHEVMFEYPFSMAKYEVPQELYEAVMGLNPSKWKGPRNSVEMVSFDDARAFCRKITGLLHETDLIGKDESIRLPNEAEWEYCCRAGTTTPYSFGESAIVPGDTKNQASLINEFGWHAGNAAGNDPPVGAKKPNTWGLYDMHGYLWEFVSDAWHETYTSAPTDGSSWSSEGRATRRVVRGGSWKDRYECLRSAHRRPIEADAEDDAVGLRCVKAKRS